MTSTFKPAPLFTVTWTNEKGAGCLLRAKADHIARRLPRLRGTGTITNERGEIVGGLVPCDRSCGRTRCRSHYWFDVDETAEVSP